MTASASSFLSRARAHNNTTTLRWSREAAGLTWRSSLARRIRERDASRGARAAARSVDGRWIAARVGHTLGGARSHENGARAWVFRTRGGGRGGARAVGAGSGISRECGAMGLSRYLRAGLSRGGPRRRAVGTGAQARRAQHPRPRADGIWRVWMRSPARQRRGVGRGVQRSLYCVGARSVSVAATQSRQHRFLSNYRS